MRKKIILDCDPGHDDAIAIMVAGTSEKFDLLGITTVAGNQTIEKVTNNALKICDYLDLDIPVYKGMTGPLMRKNQIIAEYFHGKTGLDGIKLPDTERKAEKEHAVNFIINALLNSREKIILIPVGPLTNIAMALKLEPMIKEKIEKIVLMGGSCKGGNVTPYAEFNIYADPEAASIVFSSGVPVRMMSLEVTNKTLPDVKIMESLNDTDTKKSDFLYRALHFPERYDENGNFIYHTLHDVVTLIYLIDENTVKLEKTDCEIELKDNEKYGQTICGNCNCSENTDKSVSDIETAVEIDLTKFWDIIFDIVKK